MKYKKPKPSFQTSRKRVGQYQNFKSSDDVVVQYPACDDSIKVFLDDERTCPPGYMLARSPHAFFKLIDDEDLAARIVELSLDWYLGVGVSDGLSVANTLAGMLKKNPMMFPKLNLIRCHSSDMGMARRMVAVFENVADDAFRNAHPTRDFDIIAHTR